jgi:hypothetical protein
LFWCKKANTSCTLVSENKDANLLRREIFLGGVTATAPSRDLTDNKKKRREGSSRGESKRKLLKETQNQRKETRKKKKKSSRVQS